LSFLYLSTLQAQWILKNQILIPQNVDTTGVAHGIEEIKSGVVDSLAAKLEFLTHIIPFETQFNVDTDIVNGLPAILQQYTQIISLGIVSREMELAQAKTVVI